MTEQDKQLLLKDLCTRLPYGVKCRFEIDIDKYKTMEFSREETNGLLVDFDEIYCYWLNEGFILPYLRPMSSMMQGEWEEMTALIYPYGRVNRNPDNKNELLLWLNAEGNEMPIILMNNVFSWLNSHHFDYRGLIEKDLALEAPEGMYMNMDEEGYNDGYKTRPFYEEVLRRFNEQRKK